MAGGIQSVGSAPMNPGYKTDQQKMADELKKRQAEQATAAQQSGGGGGGNGFMNTMASMSVGAKAGDMLAGLGSSIGGDKYGSFSEDEQAAQSSIRSALEMIPG